MKPIRSILVLLDPDMRHGRALQRALLLAQACDARLCLGMLACDRRLEAITLGREPARLAQRAYVQERQAWLEDCRVRARLPPGRVTTAVTWSPHGVETFLQMLRDCGADLVLKDASCAGAPLSALLTPLDWKLLRRCPVPFMLMAPQGPFLPRRILAAVDTSSAQSDPEGLNAEIVAAARQLASGEDRELHLASAFPETPTITAVYPLAGEIVEEARREHSAALEALRRASGIEPARCHRLRGEPVLALRRFAAGHQVDLLVMGSHYRKGIERLLLGSTTEEMLLQPGRDVLLVRPSIERLALPSQH